MPAYWENSYKSGNIGWDLGGPTPIFDDWIKFQKGSLSICILGAGNGWDAINFAEKGHNVTAVDFAESAINNMHIYALEKGVQINLIHCDIFNLEKRVYPGMSWDFDSKLNTSAMSLLRIREC